MAKDQHLFFSVKKNSRRAQAGQSSKQIKLGASHQRRMCNRFSVTKRILHGQSLGGTLVYSTAVSKKLPENAKSWKPLLAWKTSNRVTKKCGVCIILVISPKTRTKCWKTSKNWLQKLVVCTKGKAYDSLCVQNAQMFDTCGRRKYFALARYCWLWRIYWAMV